VTPHQLTEIGFALAIAGGLFLALGAAIMLWADRSYEGATRRQHRREKLANLFGAILLSGAAVLELIATIKR
jgi:uncharacterized membrane protein SpoIIM required for sporulation